MFKNAVHCIAHLCYPSQSLSTGVDYPSEKLGGAITLNVRQLHLSKELADKSDECPIIKRTIIMSLSVSSRNQIR